VETTRANLQSAITRHMQFVEEQRRASEAQTQLAIQSVVEMVVRARESMCHDS